MVNIYCSGYWYSHSFLLYVTVYDYTHKDGTVYHEPINAQPLLLNEELHIYNHRKINELPYCLTKSDRLSELQDLICDWSWIVSKNEAMSCEDYVADFAPLVPTVSE